MKYRKRPIVIDAIQWPGDMNEDDPRIEEVEDWCFEMKADPNKIIMMDDGTVSITTLEGQMTANPGDWIIRGITGEFYSRDPDIFAATYEPIMENTNG